MNGWTGHILRVNLTDENLQERTVQRGVRPQMGRRPRLRRQDPLRRARPRGSIRSARTTSSSSPWGRSPASRPPTPGKRSSPPSRPLTGVYGDGNLGTRVAEQLRKAGYDALIVEGKADRPTMLYIEDDKVEFLPADAVWGQGTYATNDWIYAKYGKGVGVLNIGQGGENLVRYAVVRSLEGRAGGRTGMGAVMGSKLLKAIVVKGTKPIPQADPAGMKKVGLRRPARGPPDRQGDRLVHPEHERRPGLVQRGRGPAGPQLPQDPPPRRLEDRRRAAEQRPHRHLRLPQLHHALRHHHPRRRGPRVRARLRERRPPRAQPGDLRPPPGRRRSTTSATTTAWTRCRPAASSASTPTPSTTAPSPATSSSATPTGQGTPPA